MNLKRKSLSFIPQLCKTGLCWTSESEMWENKVIEACKQRKSARRVMIPHTRERILWKAHRHQSSYIFSLFSKSSIILIKLKALHLYCWDKCNVLHMWVTVIGNCIKNPNSWTKSWWHSGTLILDLKANKFSKFDKVSITYN